MSCPKTAHLLQEYFADDLAPLAREELDAHLASCDSCNAELESLLLTQTSLLRWQDQRVPHWDRGLELFKREHRVSGASAGSWSPWQWLPTAASFAMLCLLLLNTTLVSNEQGFAISFGGDRVSQPDITEQLAVFQQQQQAEMQALVTRVEDRQDSSNVQLLQAVMDRTQQNTAENLDRIYAYFEQQRLLDLQDMRVGYQQLVDSDYETIRSLQQLAQFVSYQGDLR